MKEPIEHRDKLGTVLAVGDCVTYPHQNSLQIGLIKKLAEKMIRVYPLDKGENFIVLKYPSDIVRLNGPDISMYILKNSHK
jgi:hypothetical protein